MTTTKAITVVSDKTPGISEVTVPTPPPPGFVLVRTKAVALNPTDWKSIKLGALPAGARSGCDYAGDVVEVGEGVEGGWKKGDRIAGMTHGGNKLHPEWGAFGGYLITKTHVAAKIPDNLSYEEAATLGISVSTVAQGLHKALGLPLPTSPAPTPFPILISGASTATGLYAIQFAKASGLTVIATSSAHNFETLRSLGADHVYDYKSASTGPEIRKLTDNKLRYAWDCTGAGGELCAHALSDDPAVRPRLRNIIPIDKEVVHAINPHVDGPEFHVAYDAYGHEYDRFGTMHPVFPDEVENVARFWPVARDLLARGVVRPIPITVNSGGEGLEGILRGLQELEAGKVSASKLVYTL